MKKVAKAVSVFFFTFIMIIACFFMTGCTPSLLEVIGNYYELMGFEVEDISIDMYGKDCEVILTTDMSKEEIDKTMKKEDMFHAIYYEKKNMNYQVTKIKINDVTYEE